MPEVKKLHEENKKPLRFFVNFETLWFEKSK